MVWNIFYFPTYGNNHPNWLSYFSEGFKPPTRWGFPWMGVPPSMGGKKKRENTPLKIWMMVLGVPYDSGNLQVFVGFYDLLFLLLSLLISTVLAYGICHQSRRQFCAIHCLYQGTLHWELSRLMSKETINQLEIPIVAGITSGIWTQWVEKNSHALPVSGTLPVYLGITAIWSDEFDVLSCHSCFWSSKTKNLEIFRYTVYTLGIEHSYTKSPCVYQLSMVHHL